MQELCEAPGIWAKIPQAVGVWDNVQGEHRCGVPVDLEREGVRMEPLVSLHPVCVCVYHKCVLHLTADGTWPQGTSASMSLGW